MQFKVNRKSFIKEVERLMTKGRFNLKTKEDYQIKSAQFILTGNVLVMMGNSINQNLYGCNTINVDGKGDGNIFIPSLSLLVDDSKSLKGSEITITIDDALNITDGKQSYSYKLGSTKGFKNIDEWYDCHAVADDGVVYQWKEESYVYKRWFAVESPVELAELPNIVYKKMAVDNCTFKTVKDGIEVVVENKSNGRKYNDKLVANVFEEKEMKVGRLFAVLGELDGKTTVFYHLLSSGKLRYWVSNGSMQWMIKYVGFSKEEEDAD